MSYLVLTGSIMVALFGVEYLPARALLEEEAFSLSGWAKVED